MITELYAEVTAEERRVLLEAVGSVSRDYRPRPADEALVRELVARHLLEPNGIGGYRTTGPGWNAAFRGMRRSPWRRWR